MKTKSFKQISAILGKEQKIIAASRDRLRALFYEVEEQLESCDMAAMTLQDVIDQLSEYV